MSRDIFVPSPEPRGFRGIQPLVEVLSLSPRFLSSARSERTGLSDVSDSSWFCDACADRFLTLASGDGWQAANHGPIFDSRPIAFFGYPRRHRVGRRLGAGAHYGLTFPW